MMRRQLQRGVSLIEAVVAMAVMAIGMLGVVGMQATLRSNGDLARQRAEAVRIAQETIEDWRRFVAVETSVANMDYAEIVTTPASSVVGINATYSVTRSVPVDTVSPRLKSIQVSVAWVDRTNQAQSVALSSAISGAAPELAGSISLRQSGAPNRQPLGRSRSIPWQARDLGNNTSAFVPPQPSGGTVGWVFNNTTGLITGVCTLPAGTTSATVTLADVASCSDNTSAQLLSGFVRFAPTGASPTAATAEQPMGLPLNLDISLALTSTGHSAAPLCFDDAESVAATATPGAAVTYYCIIFNNTSQKWGGRSRVVPVGTPPWTIASIAAASVYKICRYTTLTADTGTRNADHPLDYFEPAGAVRSTSLTNQDFLVISAAHSCPSDTPTIGDFVNSNTRLHQDGSATYSN